MSSRAKVWALIVGVSVILSIIVSGIVIYQFVAAHQLISPTSSTSINTGTSGGDAGSCTGYDLTHENVTKTFPNIVVPDGCVLVVQAWSAQGLPENWPDSVGVEGIGPGTYTFTLTSGSYQMTTTAGGQAQYCYDIQSLKTRGLPDAYNYPMAGWSC